MKTLLWVLMAVFGTLGLLRAVEEPPVITVAIHGSRELEPRGLVALWADGKIVWSEDQKDGGAPYRTAKMDAEKLRAFLAKLEQQGLFKKGPDFLRHFGPDGSYHGIRVRSGKKVVELASWHELYERNPKTVATSHGLEGLDGRDRAELLKGDTKDYQEFRRLWLELRVFVKGLVPKEGAKFEGKVAW